MTDTSINAAGRDYPAGELVRRLLGVAWHYRADFLLSLGLSLLLLLLGLLGLQLLGVVIDVIRHALDASQQAPVYPFGWMPPAVWPALRVVTVLSLAIIAQAVLRAVLTYAYNLTTARLTQGEIVPDLRDQLYARLQRLSFPFFDLHGSSSIFNRVTGDVQNTRLFVDGVLLQGINMLLTLAAYGVFMWRIHPSLTVACLGVALPLWWVTHYFSGRLRPAYLRNREITDHLVQLFSESIRGMQTVKGFAAEPHQIGPLRGSQLAGLNPATPHFPRLVHLHAVDAIVVPAQSGDSVQLWRVALHPGTNSIGRRIGCLCRIAATIQRPGRQHFHHRQLRPTKSRRRPPCFRGARHAPRRGKQTRRRRPAASDRPGGV